MDSRGDKIIQYHLEEFVQECVKQNYTPAEIAINIKNTYGIELSSIDVGRYLESMSDMEKDLARSNMETLVIKEVPMDLARIDSLISFFWEKIDFDAAREDSDCLKDMLMCVKVLMDLWSLKFKHIGVSRSSEPEKRMSADQKRVYEILKKQGINLDSGIKEGDK